jgi:hypothetical protein
VNRYRTSFTSGTGSNGLLLAVVVVVDEYDLETDEAVMLVEVATVVVAVVAVVVVSVLPAGEVKFVVVEVGGVVVALLDLIL